MGSEETAQDILKNFRAWAESDAVTGEDDFETLSEFIVSLFKNIDALPAIRFVAAQAQDYLPTFEQLNPEIRWPREVLEKIEQLEELDFKNPDYRFFGDSRVYDEHNVPIPRGLPFVDAITDLRNVPTYYKNQYERSWNENGALNVGMAFVSILWARRCPKQVAAFWAGKRSREGGDEYEASLTEYVKSGRIYIKSKERKRILRRLCLTAADDLEVLLQKKNG